MSAGETAAANIGQAAGLIVRPARGRRPSSYFLSDGEPDPRGLSGLGTVLGAQAIATLVLVLSARLSASAWWTFTSHRADRSRQTEARQRRRQTSARPADRGHPQGETCRPRTAPLTLPAELLPKDGRFGSGPSKVRPEQVEYLASLGTTVLGTSHRQAR